MNNEPAAANNRRLFWIIFISLTIISLIPIWMSEFLPFVDYPQHLGVSHILHNYYTNSLYSHYFQINFFPKCNIVHILILYLLNFILPVQIAGKVLLSLYVFLLPFSLVFLIKSLDGNRWIALLSFLFIYNFSLMWGFNAYCLAIPFFFMALSIFFEYSKKPEALTYRQAVLILFFLLIIFLTHPLVYAITLTALFILLFLSHGLNLKKYKVILLSLPSLLIFLFFTHFITQGKTIISTNFRLSELIPLMRHRFTSLPYVLAITVPEHIIIFRIFFGIVAYLFVRGLFVKKIKFNSRTLTICALIILTFLGYLLLPGQTSTMALIGLRLSIFVPLLFIALIGQVKIKEDLVIGLIASVLSAVLVINLMGPFNRFNKEARQLLEVLKNTERNKEIVELYYSGTVPYHLKYPSFLHFACYYQILKDGLAARIFLNSNAWYILERRVGVPRKEVNEWKASRSIFPNGWENYDYFLVCGFPPQDEDKYYHMLDFMGRKGIWAIYKNPLKK